VSPKHGFNPVAVYLTSVTLPIRVLKENLYNTDSTQTDKYPCITFLIVISITYKFAF